MLPVKTDGVYTVQIKNYVTKIATTVLRNRLHLVIKQNIGAT
jgi:hypothetical protein